MLRKILFVEWRNVDWKGKSVVVLENIGYRKTVNLMFVIISCRSVFTYRSEFVNFSVRKIV